MLENKIYEELLVEPVINASGTKTTHGGTRVAQNVLDAMSQASENFVSINELNNSIGKYISGITGSESAMVTSGAASGVVLSIAACMTGTNSALVRQLPDSSGMKNEVVMQKIHAGAYSHMYSFSGAKIKEIGHIGGCSEDDLENSINENTAAIAFLFGPRISRCGLTLPEVVKIAKKHSIPVIVDAAAMLPPKINLSKYINQGADLVTISGGKFLRGPQNSGILFGSKKLVDAAISNSNPQHSIGRPHKVSRETMVGLYVALKNYMSLDEQKLFNDYNSMLKKVQIFFEGIKCIKSEIVHDWVNYNVPVIAISSQSNDLDLSIIPSILLQESPRVFLQYFSELQHIVINPISLTLEEAEIAASKLAKILKNYD